MFFKKKKPKIDPKIRFQNRQFNQKLQEARTFKRTAKPIPEGNFELFLRRIGLGSRWAQIFVALIALGVAYLIYAPNFLTVKNIKIEGLSESDQSLVQSAVQDKLNNTPFYNPQHNLLFLSKDRVKEAVMTVSGIDTIEKITKSFGQKTVTIVAHPKHERFLVRSANSVYDVYNDGTLKGQAGVNRDDWVNIQNPSMAKIDLGANVSAQQNAEFFTPETVAYITSVQEALKGITGSSLAYFSIRIPELKQQQELEEQQKDADVNPDTDPTPDKEGAPPTDGTPTDVSPEDTAPVVEPVVTLPVVDINLPISADELDIYFQKGNDPKRTFKVIVDTKENPDQMVQWLNLLLSQTTPDRYNNLSYIDLRIETRAFLCLLNSPCIR